MLKPMVTFALAVSLASPGIAQAPAPAAAPPPACTDASHRAFDFWVGKWDVYPTGKPRLVAHSLIENLYDGCGIRENWMPLRGNTGGSLSSYDSFDKRWHQRWIDGQGSVVDFDGGPVNGGMVMTGLWRGVLGPGQDALVRMTYTKNTDGSVRQLGTQSVDQGVTWQPSFDFTYKPAAAPTK